MIKNKTLNLIHSNIMEFKICNIWKYRYKKLMFSKKLKTEFIHGTMESILKIFENEIKDVYGISNKIWNFRALLMLTHILEILVWHRDNEQKCISISKLKFYLHINNFCSLYQNPNLPENLVFKTKEYTKIFPGYDDTLTKQPEKTNAYFNYTSMIIIHILDERFS